MSAGLPIVGTDIAGVREAVGPIGYRFLSPPDNPNAMADRILELATNPQLRMRVGVLNQERVQKEFGITRMCHETVGMITEALK
jgi:glycosyltransferase involved in cell wall biosynthesis